VQEGQQGGSCEKAAGRQGPQGRQGRQASPLGLEPDGLARSTKYTRWLGGSRVHASLARRLWSLERAGATTDLLKEDLTDDGWMSICNL
jgi:hypothetical protein